MNTKQKIGVFKEFSTDGIAGGLSFIVSIAETIYISQTGFYENLFQNNIVSTVVSMIIGLGFMFINMWISQELLESYQFSKFSRKYIHILARQHGEGIMQILCVLSSENTPIAEKIFLHKILKRSYTDPVIQSEDDLVNFMTNTINFHEAKTLDELRLVLRTEANDIPIEHRQFILQFSDCWSIYVNNGQRWNTKDVESDIGNI